MNWPLASRDRLLRDQVESARAGIDRRSGDASWTADRDDVLAFPAAGGDEQLPPGPAAVIVTVLSAGLWFALTIGCVALVG